MVLGLKVNLVVPVGIGIVQGYFSDAGADANQNDSNRSYCVDFH